MGEFLDLTIKNLETGKMSRLETLEITGVDFSTSEDYSVTSFIGASGTLTMKNVNKRVIKKILKKPFKELEAILKHERRVKNRNELYKKLKKRGRR